MAFGLIIGLLVFAHKPEIATASLSAVVGFDKPEITTILSVVAGILSFFVAYITVAPVVAIVLCLIIELLNALGKLLDALLKLG